MNTLLAIIAGVSGAALILLATWICVTASLNLRRLDAELKRLDKAKEYADKLTTEQKIRLCKIIDEKVASGKKFVYADSVEQICKEIELAKFIGDSNPC